jgi:ADP-L-glycero-D-manno-heptose 6-epimerase
MKRILVTGAAGFVGARLVASLESQGKCVSKIDEEYFKTENWKSSLLSYLDKEIPEAIFHVGACSDTLEQDSQLMMLRNYESTKTIVNWATKNGAKIIYSSSAANYGENGSYPSNIYGWSKYAAEDYVRLNQGISLRYFNVYGPGENHKGRMASFFLQAHIKNFNGEEIKLFPKKPVRDFVYINDVLSANLYALDNFGNLKAGVYDVGSCEPRSFEEGLSILNLKFSYTKESDIPKGYQFYTSGNKAKLMPGWNPQYSLERGLKDYGFTPGNI